MFCAIWSRLYYFKNVKNTHEGMLLLVLLKVILLHGCFLHFSYCFIHFLYFHIFLHISNGTKSRNASQIFYIKNLRVAILQKKFLELLENFPNTLIFAT